MTSIRTNRQEVKVDKTEFQHTDHSSNRGVKTKLVVARKQGALPSIGIFLQSKNNHWGALKR